MNTMDLDRMTALEILRAMNREDEMVPLAIRSHLEEIAQVVQWGKDSLGQAGRIKAGLKLIGDIFVPLIPGIITAGLCAGFASLIAQTVPDYGDKKVWSIIWFPLS